MRKKSKVSKKCLPAAEAIGGNEDFLSQILPHLPVKSLSRFKIVSKQWRALICDRQFSLSHACKNPSYSIPSRSSSTTLFLEISTSATTSETIFIAIQIKLYCIHNLATNQMKMIPLPKLYEDDPIVTCNLAFDLLASPYYKIVCVKNGGKLLGSRIIIYSSETGHWKDANIPTNRMSVKFAKGIYCQGAIYWVGNDFLSCYCFRFDVEAEKLRRVSMPEGCLRGVVYFRYFGEFNGRLHLVCSRYLTEEVFCIYELDKDTERWFVKYRVHMDFLTSLFPEIVVKGVYNDCQYAFSILCVVSGENDEDSFLIMTIPGKVISYYFKRTGIEVLSELPSLEKMKFQGSNAYPFVPTLYPL
ncbi:F-box protein At5g07610-like [Apium graveolens]|uniref:F-box protein At5g07610-like n=1 Tax=Apium graveolens TaxID=4045 RepID=UPI003D78FF96